MDYVLGLDLGTTSIGWAVAELGEDERPKRLIDANSRIFLSMVDAEKKEPKNKNRRLKRGMRKLTKRYKLRRAKLVKTLSESGFADADFLNPADWERKLNKIENPYRLRARAVEAGNRLSLLELSRVFLHLLKRRGYKSNRGAKFVLLLKALNERGLALAFKDEQVDDDDDDTPATDKQAKEETGKVLRGLALLETAMEQAKCNTVAQLIVKLADDEGQRDPMRPHTRTRSESTKKGKEIQRNLYVSREMCEEEFGKIWNCQSKHHESLMTDELKIKVHQAIFFQRPLESQRGRVGKCSLVIQKSRAAKMLLESQEFLVLDDLNKLKYSLPKKDGEFSFANEQRHAILATLADSEKMKGKGSLSWADIKSIAELPKTTKFNLERTSKGGLRGNRTHLTLARTIPAKWLALGQSVESGETFSKSQIALVRDLVQIEDKVALFNRLTNYYNLPENRNPWRFTSKEAFDLTTLELEEGFIKHCSQVVSRMLPSMRKGAMYSDAVQAAGYLRRDQKESKGLARLPAAPEIANPIVQKALFETRRVVNALIDKHGKPKIIRMEMARDMKASKAHRAEMDDRNKKNQKANDDAATAIRVLSQKYPALGIRVSREAIIKYKLWKEQGEVCAYSFSEITHDKTISDRMLFDASTEVDHIYPLSISLDDSQMNKVLCMRAENMEKGQKTPWQAWHGTEKYEHILKRFERKNLPHYPLAKLKRLKDDKFDAGADFAAAQLNDTRYICVAVRNYLATLGYDDQHLQVSRGQMTAELRKLWELTNTLPRTEAAREDAPVVDTETGEILGAEEDKSAKKEKKKDRGDHRHHAIDAIVTALVDGQVFKDLMRRYRWREENGAWPATPLECPIPDLRHATEKIVMQNVVSHSAKRKISGGLHQELPFGLGAYVKHRVPLKPTRKLLNLKNIVLCDPDRTPGKSLDGGDQWIVDPAIRIALREWFAGRDKADKSRLNDYPPPSLPDGMEITIADVAVRCYVKRVGVEKALERLANDPGVKTWIVDQHIREILKEWLKTHKAVTVQDDPPRMRRNDGDMNKAPPIRKVRVAMNESGLVRFGMRPQIFAKGSNHHVVVFKRNLPDGTIERKGVFVDMLEAAKRARSTRDLPIIRTDSAQLLAIDPTVNREQWLFDIALCAQDMVLWDEKLTPADHKLLGPPIYRLQKMSGPNNSLIFRHFSVTSTSDSDSRGIIRSVPNSLACRKIQIDPLGKWEPASGD